MTDVMSAEKRSALMSKIQGKNTKPEVEVRRMLWRAGLRYRLHPRGLPGRPDIVLPRWKATVLINGCFWHAHQDCALFQLPATRPDFWLDKLMGNRVRDTANVYSLAAQGWRTAVVWECALRLDMAAVGASLTDWIKSGKPGCEILRVESMVELRPLDITTHAAD
jgi:DNA mismatch endonuclease (patch repair protein)